MSESRLNSSDWQRQCRCALKWLQLPWLREKENEAAVAAATGELWHAVASGKIDLNSWVFEWEEVCEVGMEPGKERQTVVRFVEQAETQTQSTQVHLKETSKEMRETIGHSILLLLAKQDQRDTPSSVRWCVIASNIRWLLSREKKTTNTLCQWRQSPCLLLLAMFKLHARRQFVLITQGVTCTRT